MVVACAQLMTGGQNELAQAFTSIYFSLRPLSGVVQRTRDLGHTLVNKSAVLVSSFLVTSNKLPDDTQALPSRDRRRRAAAGNSWGCSLNLNSRLSLAVAANVFFITRAWI